MNLKMRLTNTLLMSASCLMLLSACSTVPVKMNFPTAPSTLLQEPPKLKSLNSSTQSTTTTQPITK